MFIFQQWIHNSFLWHKVTKTASCAIYTFAKLSFYLSADYEINLTNYMIIKWHIFGFCFQLSFFKFEFLVWDHKFHFSASLIKNKTGVKKEYF